MNKNHSNLDRMRKHARDIFQAGLDAVDPVSCIKKHCRLNQKILHIGRNRFNLDRFDKIVLLGAGKASAAMAKGLEDLLKDRIDTGLIVTKYGHGLPLKKITVIEAGHPFPDENGVRAAGLMLETAQKADEKTLILVLLSGGASALIPLPADNITLKEKQQTTRVLIECGADIRQINTIRKHLSRIKGGRLATAADPATMACLVMSDVVGNDFPTIASGPAVPDPTTFRECLNIINAYQISDRIPARVLAHIKKGIRGLADETPKCEKMLFNHISHTIVSDNYAALLNAEKKARSLNYNSLILSSMIEGDAVQAALFTTAIAKQILASGHPLPKPACILWGGETTVVLKGTGKGGRNQEFALHCVEKISGLKDTVIFSCGTDGTDGPTDAAGAVVDHATLKKAVEMNLDIRTFQKENDAWHFFDKTGDLVKTGPTRTNVMDICLVLVR